MTGEKIRNYRLRNNITQVELAKKLEVSKSFLSNVESGKRKASMKLINKLSEITAYDYDFWTEQVVEITCSDCKRKIDMKVRNGNNNLRVECECGRSVELVLIISTQIEAVYEVRETDLNLENLRIGIGGSKRWL